MSLETNAELEAGERDAERIAALLADQDAFIAELSDEQKTELLSCVMTSLFGWPCLSRGEPEEQRLRRMVRAARDDFEEAAIQLIESSYA